MKQKQIIHAYNALTRLYSKPMSFKEAYKIFVTRKALEEFAVFQMDREHKIIEEHGGKIQMDGTFHFDDESVVDEVAKMIDELGEMEVDFTPSPATIKMEAIENVSITPYDLECLQGFVNFE